MWGYVKTDKLNLLVKDYYSYQNAYCSLCHTLGKKYGLCSRIMLNYDVTFLLLCLDSLEKKKDVWVIRCPLNPLKRKKMYFSQRALEYSAFINYYLVLLKLKDDVADDNSKKKALIYHVLKRNKTYQREKEKYEKQLERYEIFLNEFTKLEHDKADFDKITNTFGDYFSGIFMTYFECFQIGNSTDRENMYSFSFNLGKWIYIMDAYEDYNRDVKQQKYNCLLNMMNLDYTTEKVNVHKKIRAINGMLIFNMKKAKEKIAFKEHDAIIENVICNGCFFTYKRILQKEYPEINRKFFGTMDN